jgi:nitroreductase
MDFYETVNRRRTSRQWLEKDVDFEVIKRILEAGNKAPTWDHHRSWHYIVLQPYIFCPSVTG